MSMKSKMMWRGSASSGMTLTELLVAMVILLVGVYTIVQGFPALFRNIEGERVRTEMARVAERTVERLKTNPEKVPEAITGHDPTSSAVINPYSRPDAAASVQAGNSHDDMRWILGEMIKAPAADVGDSVAAYSFSLGPAASDLVEWPVGSGTFVWAMQGAVREVTGLERLARAPAGAIPEGTFYIGQAGTLMVPSQYDAALVDYAWVDRAGYVHYVWDEYVGAGTPVRATLVFPGPPEFANVLPGSCRARGVIEHYPVLVGSAAAVAPGTFILEQNFGATLLLHQSDFGRVLQIDYALKSEDDTNGSPRRVPLVMEEVAAPTVEPYEVVLSFRGVDDENALYTMDMSETALPANVFVLIVDTQSGATWTENNTFVTLDMLKGTVKLDWDDASAPMTAAQARGRELRIYYRTLDRHNVEVMKAPRFFIEDVVAATYYATGQGDAVDYREFSVTMQAVTPPAPALPGTYATLTFPESMAGMAVSVDYLHGVAPPYARVSNEFHVVDATSFTVVLTQPDVQAIVAVQGLTLKARGWWETQRGRLESLDIDTFLTPQSLL